ncbi:MAG TPA: Lrp/AsnC family transcriptional regulator [Alcaligenes sp.]|nr:Lrp/AsnC family transcriptional regulator [Alcaligenes sp.]HRL28130.1 Lrp/AsnC family transcriptional regulator [Alcaligenes sp.]
MTNPTTPFSTHIAPLDEADRRIINTLQRGFPVCPHPFALIAPDLGLNETELIHRIALLRTKGVLSRFGPLFNAEALGGAYCLAAMAVPDLRWDSVLAAVNRHIEVAHNYRRDHDLNMWFVLAAPSANAVHDCIAAIEHETALAVLAFPKEREYYVNMYLEI